MQFGGEENSSPAAAAEIEDPQGLIEQGARFVADMRHQSKTWKSKDYAKKKKIMKPAAE
jgi:hypothetical protein